MRALVIALTLAALCPLAAADPLQISIHSQVSVPDLPAITLTAQEPVQGLTISLKPGPAPKDEPGPANRETGAQSFSKKSLAPGQSVTYRLGTGKPGHTQWTGVLRGMVGIKSWHSDLRFDTLVSPRIKVGYDKEHLNEQQHYVEVQLSQPAGRAEVTVVGEDGTEIGSGAVAFHGERQGTWLHIPWQERKPGKVLKLDLKLHDQAGFAVGLTLVPWSVTVPHEEVNFATGSWEIEPGERGKLDESYERIKAVIDKAKPYVSPRLFVAGHTDTVGTDADNLVLSRNRARAIATYLRDKGVSVPVLYAGYGEQKLRVQTGDNVDELRNRRADYVISVDPPQPGAWQKLP